MFTFHQLMFDCHSDEVGLWRFNTFLYQISVLSEKMAVDFSSGNLIIANITEYMFLFQTFVFLVLYDSSIFSLRKNSDHKSYRGSLIHHDVLRYDHEILSLFRMQIHTYSKTVNNLQTPQYFPRSLNS